MKKTYIIPSVQTIRVAQSLPIAASEFTMGIDRNSSVNAADVDVKGSTPSYNVWDDDWSE